MPGLMSPPPQYGAFISRLEVFSLRFEKNNNNSSNNDINGKDPGDFKGRIFIYDLTYFHEIYNSNNMNDYVDIDSLLTGPNHGRLRSKRKRGPNEVSFNPKRGDSICGRPDLLALTGLIEEEMQDSVSSQKSCELNLPLIGPEEEMIIYDFFSVIVHMDSGNADKEDSYLERANLFHRMGHKFEDDVVASWIPVWHDYHDHFRSFRVYDDFGLVTLDYIVFKDSKELQLEVTLLMDDGEENNNATTDIYICGELTLHSSKFPSHKSVLFRTPPNKAAKVTSGDSVPLSKSVVAIPYDSSFTIQAALFDPHNVSIAEGSVDFPFVILNAENISHTFMKDISGRAGKIQIEVIVDL